MKIETENPYTSHVREGFTHPEAQIHVRNSSNIGHAFHNIVTGIIDGPWNPNTGWQTFCHYQKPHFSSINLLKSNLH